MVASSPTSMTIRTNKTKATRIPTIDLSMERSELSKLIVQACEEYGFFKVVNHGVPKNVILRMEEEGTEFFAKPSSEKCQVGPATPFGYGCRNIGLNGDMGNLEYLLLHTNPLSISQGSKTFANDPNKFSSAVNDYIEAAKKVAVEILDLVAHGLCVSDKFLLSNLITNFNSDSVFRINHYPSLNQKIELSKHDSYQLDSNNNNIGFGEHSDPQILTILRSNNVSGLQISTFNEFWIPVPSDPDAFFAIVGDSLQVLTNGRFRSVRHRVLINTIVKARMSMMYFAAPPLNWWIKPLPKMVTPKNPSIYKPFTWAQYKEAAYSLRLGDSRLHLFQA